jgi:hypothetical protein
LLGDAVDSHEPCVMRGPRIIQTGVAQPDDQERT